MSLNDSYILTTSSQFSNRVGASLWGWCINVANEGSSVASHFARDQFAAQVLLNQTTMLPLFVSVASVNATLVSCANSNGTVTLSTSNVATQQAVISDTSINNAVANGFVAFLGLP